MTHTRETTSIGAIQGRAAVFNDDSRNEGQKSGAEGCECQDEIGTIEITWNLKLISLQARLTGQQEARL